MVIAELQEGVDWITEPDTRSTFGKVTFSVLANEEETTREASINLLYGTLSIELNVIQASYDYVTDCGFMSGTYYGTRWIWSMMAAPCPEAPTTHSTYIMHLLLRIRTTLCPRPELMFWENRDLRQI